MPYTLQQTINWTSAFINGAPLTAFGTNEPAISTANMIQSTMTNSPLTWAWNRNENSTTSTVVGQTDYILPLTDFKALEKASLTDSTGKIWELTDVLNTAPLSGTGITDQQRPMFISVLEINYGTNVKFRLMGNPNAIYTISLTYQKLITPFTALSQPWYIPEGFKNIYNALFLAEAFEFVNDARSTQYRQRGIAQLLARAEGLSLMQKNIFMQQFMATDSSLLTNQLQAQQSSQARGA